MHGLRKTKYKIKAPNSVDAVHTQPKLSKEVRKIQISLRAGSEREQTGEQQLQKEHSWSEEL